MFDLSLGEIMLVVVAAVIFIGPKELPVVIKALAGAMQSIRSLMNELRGVFDDLAKESGFTETKQALEKEVRMIKGDDGQYYESYDMQNVMTPKPQIKDFTVPPASEEDDD